MDTRRLIVFRAVAQRLSFTDAALSLHLSQSAVSQQIAALERELGGVALLERSRRHVALTAEGAALYQRLDAILGPIVEAERAVAAAHGLIAGDLRVAASLTVGSYMIPGALAALGARHPELRLHVEIENSSQVIRSVLSGAADVGYIEDEAEHPGVTVSPLLEDELVVVASREHRFAALREVSPDQLAVESLILREPGSGTRGVAEAHLAAAGLDLGSLRLAAEIGGIEAIKTAVAAGLGVAIISRTTISNELSLGTLVARPLAGMQMRRRISVASLATASLPAARALTELVVEMRPAGAHPAYAE